MEQLHPYWRMEYIEAPRYPDSQRPFTDLPALLSADEQVPLQCRASARDPLS
jgi:hypothetical protein